MAYFPVTLVVSREQPLQFNFALWLLESLYLPAHLGLRGDSMLIPADEDPKSTASKVVKFADTEAILPGAGQRAPVQPGRHIAQASAL